MPIMYYPRHPIGLVKKEIVRAQDNLERAKPVHKTRAAGPVLPGWLGASLLSWACEDKGGESLEESLA